MPRHVGGIVPSWALHHFLGVPVHENDEPLPAAHLDCHAMTSHRFIERDDQTLKYRLIFNRQHAIPIVLPAPTLFDFQEKGRHYITREEAEEYRRWAEIARLQAAAHDAMTAESQYDPGYNFGYPPGHPWQ